MEIWLGYVASLQPEQILHIYYLTLNEIVSRVLCFKISGQSAKRTDDLNVHFITINGIMSWFFLFFFLYILPDPLSSVIGRFFYF